MNSTSNDKNMDRLAALENESTRLRATPRVADQQANNRAGTEATRPMTAIEKLSSRRGMLRASVAAMGAAVGAGALLQTQQPGIALANGTEGQTTFTSATTTPTVTISNTSTGLGLSTTNNVSLGGANVKYLTASGAVSGKSTTASAAMTGTNNSTAGSAIGVLGQISSTAPGGYSAAVRGQNNGTSANGIGVYGSQAGTGYGVYGTTAKGGIGVYGADSTSGYGGYFTSDTGTALYANSSGVYGAQIFGYSYGVQGTSSITGSGGAGVVGYGDTTSDGYGTWGKGYYGAYGSGTYGVKGDGTVDGVFGSGDSNGVYGFGNPGSSAGVNGYGDLYGGNFYSYDGTFGYGLYVGGYTAYTSGWAAYFAGDIHVDQDLYVSGNIHKAGGTFMIDHPLDPANKYLRHSFVESPDMKNIYDGVAVLDAAGTATVSLPAWFGALNRDFRYQLTSIGASGPGLYIAQEVANNQFAIAGGTAGMKVSWQVTGIRQDAWANAHRVVVEEAKTGADQGHYLHPELFGASTDRVIPRMAPQKAQSAAVPQTPAGAKAPVAVPVQKAPVQDGTPIIPADATSQS